MAQVFSCDFCEISKNTFSYRTPPVTASVYGATIASDFIANINNLFIYWHKFLEDTTENNFWKCQTFSSKYLRQSSILVEALSLRFTVILLMILMVLRNFIIILSALTGNFLFLVTIFLLTFHSIYCMDYNYSIILLFYSITGYILLLYYSCEDYINFRKSKDQSK